MESQSLHTLMFKSWPENWIKLHSCDIWIKGTQKWCLNPSSYSNQTLHWHVWLLFRHACRIPGDPCWCYQDPVTSGCPCRPDHVQWTHWLFLEDSSGGGASCLLERSWRCISPTYLKLVMLILLFCSKKCCSWPYIVKVHYVKLTVSGWNGHYSPNSQYRRELFPPHPPSQTRRSHGLPDWGQGQRKMTFICILICFWS